MKHPFWLINSSLLLLLCLSIWFVFFFNPLVPRRISLETSGETNAPARKTLTQEAIQQIFLSDLFETYRAPVVAQKEPIKPFDIPPLPSRKPVPEPPAPQPVKIIPMQQPRFLDPLQITVRGIITTQKESENCVILQDPRSPQLKTCSIGDMIEDAQIIKIAQNKVTVVRSNGQQESLYINQHEAELDQRLRQTNDWSTVVRNNNDLNYTIFGNEFTQKISTVAQLIEMLQLTTVFQKGTPIGCRIGKDSVQAFIKALGLQNGDVIKTVNKQTIGTMNERIAVYQQIQAAATPFTVEIALMRQDKQLVLSYQVENEQIASKGHESSPPTQLGTTRVLGVPSPELIEEQKMRFLQEKQLFSPTVEKMKKRDTFSMLRGANSLYKTPQTASAVSPLALSRG